MVTNPNAVITIDVDPDNPDALVLCDGRREAVVPAGGRLQVTKCHTPLKWVRLDSARSPTGWCASSGSRSPVGASGRCSPDRIEALGAINSATAEFDRGLTVLTGETGTGKTMVVTGLNLLGGARADATQVRSGSARAVVEGRFTTDDLDAQTVVAVEEVLESTGADRDDDGSVIALRSVNQDGPSRAYLGGRSVPAKILTTFTSGLLTLQPERSLRLIRPDEQRAALDQFASATATLERYRKLRDSGCSPVAI